jgi:hypothetical protein
MNVTTSGTPVVDISCTLVLTCIFKRYMMCTIGPACVGHMLGLEKWMHRLFLLIAGVSLTLATAAGWGALVPTAAHAAPDGINWSQRCTSVSNSDFGSHGQCVSYFQSVQSETGYCSGNQSFFAYQPYELIFYDANDQPIGQPFIVSTTGGCMSAFAAMKQSNWVNATAYAL